MTKVPYKFGFNSIVSPVFSQGFNLSTKKREFGTKRRAQGTESFIEEIHDPPRSFTVEKRQRSRTSLTDAGGIDCDGGCNVRRLPTPHLCRPGWFE